jgi:hypothetical protein
MGGRSINETSWISIVWTSDNEQFQLDACLTNQRLLETFRVSQYDITRGPAINSAAQSS